MQWKSAMEECNRRVQWNAVLMKLNLLLTIVVFCKTNQKQRPNDYVIQSTAIYVNHRNLSSDAVNNQQNTSDQNSNHYTTLIHIIMQIPYQKTIILTLVYTDAHNYVVYSCKITSHAKSRVFSTTQYYCSQQRMA